MHINELTRILWKIDKIEGMNPAIFAAITKLLLDQFYLDQMEIDNKAKLKAVQTYKN